MSIIDSSVGLFAAGGVTLDITIDTDQFIGTEYNLYDELGAPADAVVVNLTIDGADVGSLNIDDRFAEGSSFNVTLTNTGRILGRSPTGGDGGKSEWVGSAINTPATNGAAGGDALTLAQDISLDMDDGFILGAGGGGAGGGYDVATGTGDQNGGGGGGAGRGWGNTLGGEGGATPVGSGDDGEQYIVNPAASTDGSGGAGGNNSHAGGDGGTWGTAGSASTGTGVGSAGTFGQDIGSAVAVTVSLTGTQTKVQLETSNRLLGHYDGTVTINDPPP